MKKQIIAVCIVLLLLAGAGILEHRFIESAFLDFGRDVDVVLQKATRGAVSMQDFENLQKHWFELREHSEYLLNHMDITEIDFRLSECTTYVIFQNYEQIHAQLSVIRALTEHIPHMITPTPEHVF